MSRLAVLLVVVVGLVSACMECDCDAPGATYVFVEGFDELAQTTYGEFTVELCVDGFDCQVTSPSAGNQILTLFELGYSEEPPTTGFTVRLRGSVDVELDQGDFTIETVEPGGCCGGYHHEVRLRSQR